MFSVVVTKKRPQKRAEWCPLTMSVHFGLTGSAQPTATQATLLQWGLSTPANTLAPATPPTTDSLIKQAQWLQTQHPTQLQIAQAFQLKFDPMARLVASILSRNPSGFALYHLEPSVSPAGLTPSLSPSLSPAPSLASFVMVHPTAYTGFTGLVHKMLVKEKPKSLDSANTAGGLQDTSTLGKLTQPNSVAPYAVITGLHANTQTPEETQRLLPSIKAGLKQVITEENLKGSHTVLALVPEPLLATFDQLGFKSVDPESPEAHPAAKSLQKHFIAGDERLMALDLQPPQVSNNIQPFTPSANQFSA